MACVANYFKQHIFSNARFIRIRKFKSQLVPIEANVQIEFCISGSDVLVFATIDASAS